MAFQLKHHINHDVVKLLSDRFVINHADFDVEGFDQTVMARLESLELKDRINLVADSMAKYLPEDYPAALAIVVGATEGGLGDWVAWPLCSFVERHGVDFPQESLAAMTELTKHWSCEFAIRPFLDQHLDLTRQFLRTWVDDDHEAVRRLPSEGTRPLLPWGPRVSALSDDPQIGLELLRALRHDPSETVRRSVANHLNDVAKSHPDLVVAVLTQWLHDSDSAAKKIDDKLVRHALRTLIKQGHPGALSLLGFTTEPMLRIDQFSCTPERLSVGSSIELALTLTSTSETEQLLAIDFVVHHVKASGKTSPKVFKWTTNSLGPGASVRLTKVRKIQQATTRTYHPGFHRVELQVGGRKLAETSFRLD